MTRYILLFSALALCACNLPQSGGPKTAAPKPPRPPWVDKTVYTEGNFIFGVGKAAAEGPGCWDPGLMMDAAKNRARAEIAKSLDQTADAEGRDAKLATLKGAGPFIGWFDGESTLYALVALPTSTVTEPKIDPQVGDKPRELVDKVKRHNQAQLEKSGVCRDAHKRTTSPCCGPVTQFCSDPSRFDTKGPNNTCKCGDGPPCLFDFKCQKRQGVSRCLCTGQKCPCGILKCDAKEQCGDGRCY